MNQYFELMNILLRLYTDWPIHLATAYVLLPFIFLCAMDLIQI